MKYPTALVLILTFSGCGCTPAYPQCWAGPGFSAAARDDLISNAVPADPLDPQEAYLLKEADALNTSMGFHAKVFIVPSDNAYADPITRNIYIGSELLNTLRAPLDKIQASDVDLKNYQGTEQAALRFVLDHEFGHLLQFSHWDQVGNTPFPNPTPLYEVQADWLAGLWIGYDLTKAGADIQAVLTAFNTASASGDKDWVNPFHHGSPDSRKRAAGNGARAGQNQILGTRDSAYLTNQSKVYESSLTDATEVLKKDKNQHVF